MDNSITAIIEMDKKAREVSDAAAKKAEEIISAAKAKKDALAKESTDELAAKTGARFSELRAVSDMEISASEKKADERCRVLDEKMAAAKDGWKKEILDNILNIG